MADDDLERRLDQIKGYADELVKGYWQMHSRSELMGPLLHCPETQEALRQKLKNSEGAHAYNQIVPMLAIDLARDLGRLVLDKHSNVASLRNLVRKARARDLLRRLHDTYVERVGRFDESAWEDQPLPREIIDRINDRRQRQASDAFCRTWEHASTQAQSLWEGDTAVAIGKLRDKYVAHLEMQPLHREPKPFDIDDLGITYADLLRLRDESREPIFELFRIITGHAYVIDDFLELHHRRAQQMWKILSQ